MTEENRETIIDQRRQICAEIGQAEKREVRPSSVPPLPHTAEALKRKGESRDGRENNKKGWGGEE